MKKRNIIMTAAVALVASAGLFAAAGSPEIDLSLAANSNVLAVNNRTISMSIEPEASIYFDGNNGINARISWNYDGGSNIGAGLGYTYKNRLNDTMDLAVKAGFDYSGSFSDDASRHGYGIYLGADVITDIDENWFVSVGMRDSMEFAHTTKIGDLPSSTETDFNNLLVIPRVAVGYSF